MHFLTFLIFFVFFFACSVLAFPITQINNEILTAQNTINNPIFPILMGKIYENKNFSHKACLFFIYDNLEVVDLHDISIPYRGTNLLICPNSESGIKIGDNSISNYKFSFQNNIITLAFTLQGESLQKYEIVCGEENKIDDVNKKIIATKACGYRLKLRYFLFKYNYVIGNFLFFTGIILLLFGSIYQKGSLMLSITYLFFYIILSFFELIRVNVFSRTSNADGYYWGFLIIVMILGPVLGFFLSKNNNILKILNGIVTGFIVFKYIIYYLILLKFKNFLVINVYVGFVCHIIFAIIGGIVYYFVKNQKILLTISTSTIGSYFIISSCAILIGGMPIEIYAGLLAEYGDFEEANSYLNRSITIFYIILFIILGIIGGFFQTWKMKQIKIVEKPMKKTDKTLSIEQKSYQLMNQTSAE